VRKLVTASIVLSLSAPATAQLGSANLRPTAPAHPVGTYAGVEPGDGAPPPAVARIANRRRQRPQPTSVITWPGFSPLANGGSRFFVQTSDAVMPQVSVEQGRVVLLFRNTRTHLENSSRWLETAFFNTPVARARIERRGRNLAFVLHLRAAAAPQVSVEPGPSGAFHYVYIDFAPGNYAPVNNVVSAPGPRAPESLPTNDGPAAAPMRTEDPMIRAMENERPPVVQP
jgi:hypothetical protein